MGGFVGTMPVGTLNVALSNFAKQFRNNAFVGELLAPRVPVARQSFQYVVWNRDDQARAPQHSARAWRPPHHGAARPTKSTAPMIRRLSLQWAIR